MKKLTVFIFGTFIVIAAVYALEYIESSSGLGTPELEAGRTEIEFADIDNDARFS